MHRIVRDLQLQVRRASFVGTRRGYWDVLQHRQNHRLRGGVGCQENLLIYPQQYALMKIRLPQREDVWSMKERYCIDRGHQPSQVGSASGQHYHRLHSGSKHASHVCSEHERFRTFRGKEPI
jgi:hypothetical protein